MQLDGELEGDDRVQPFWEIRVLDPGEVHSLQEQVEPLDSDSFADETRANGRAIARVLAHVAVVVDGFNGDLWGYWLHPDEPAGVGPLIVKLDTEGQFSIEHGASLVEAMIFDWAGEDDVSEIVEYCDRHGIPLAAHSSNELLRVQAVVDPGVLHEKLYKREHPYHRRPAWADEAGAVPDFAPIGARSDDARVARALLLHGFPADIALLISAADVGEGEVCLGSDRCPTQFEFHRENDHAWFLHQIRFYDARNGLPASHDVPFGLDMNETREQCWARLGEPRRRSPHTTNDRWEFGHVSLFVVYGDDGKPRAVRCQPTLG